MDIKRPYWVERLQKAWKAAPIVWLAGVRRSGKTTLATSGALGSSEYFNCDLPSVREQISHPERFLKAIRAPLLVLDEVHQLEEASTVLKIAADQFKELKVLATGSSTLVASKKFKDTLTGRKRNVHFLPVLVSELEAFGCTWQNRLLRGGLPPALLAQNLDLDFYAEWMDSFYARDVQELFRVEKRQPFLKALEYLLAQNGAMLDATKFAQAAGIARPTAVKYLDVLETTRAISVIRPFSTNSTQEIVSQPKVYGFDTGFCNFVQGVRSLSPGDIGPLLENIVLETLQSVGLGDQIRYWRTKSKHEIDFVLPLARDNVLAIECKAKERNFDSSALEIFRKRHPHGENWIVTTDSISREEKLGTLTLKWVNVEDLQKVTLTVW